MNEEEQCDASASDAPANCTDQCLLDTSSNPGANAGGGCALGLGQEATNFMFLAWSLLFGWIGLRIYKG